MLVVDAALVVELALDGLGEQAGSLLGDQELVAPCAEYLALARLLDTRVVTLDLRLRRGAERLGLVVTPNELTGATEVESAADPDEPPLAPG